MLSSTFKNLDLENYTEITESVNPEIIEEPAVVGDPERIQIQQLDDVVADTTNIIHSLESIKETLKKEINKNTISGKDLLWANMLYSNSLRKLGKINLGTMGLESTDVKRDADTALAAIDKKLAEMRLSQESFISDLVNKITDFFSDRWGKAKEIEAKFSKIDGALNKCDAPEAKVILKKNGVAAYTTEGKKFNGVKSMIDAVNTTLNQFKDLDKQLQMKNPNKEDPTQVVAKKEILKCYKQTTISISGTDGEIKTISLPAKNIEDVEFSAKLSDVKTLYQTLKTAIGYFSSNFNRIDRSIREFEKENNKNDTRVMYKKLSDLTSIFYDILLGGIGFIMTYIGCNISASVNEINKTTKDKKTLKKYEDNVQYWILIVAVLNPLLGIIAEAVFSNNESSAWWVLPAAAVAGFTIIAVLFPSPAIMAIGTGLSRGLRYGYLARIVAKIIKK